MITSKHSELSHQSNHHLSASQKATNYYYATLIFTSTSDGRSLKNIFEFILK